MLSIENWFRIWIYFLATRELTVWNLNGHQGFLWRCNGVRFSYDINNISVFSRSSHIFSLHFYMHIPPFLVLYQYMTEDVSIYSKKTRLPITHSLHLPLIPTPSSRSSWARSRVRRVVAHIWLTPTHNSSVCFLV